jgi:hypothetical protein
MRFIKNFKKYQESIKIEFGIINLDINESLGLLYDSVLKSIGAEEADIFNTFHLPKDDFSDKLNLDLLTTSTEFVNSLSSIGLKKSNITNSEDFETFFKRPCRFMFIHRIEANELENPSYIIFQPWSDVLNKWEDCKLYKVNGDIKNFYDKLSSKVIEVQNGEERYIYQTSNGNEWTLQNVDKSNDIFKKYFRTDEFEKVLKDNRVTINII